MKLPNYLVLACALGILHCCLVQTAIGQDQCNSIEWEIEEASQTTKPASFDAVDAFIYQAPQKNIQAVVVLKEGRLAYETYPNKYATYTLHDIRSATKSIIALLVGIAVDQGKLRKDDTLVSFFPEHEFVGKDDERKKRITIDHLLTMASGLDADSDDSDSPGYDVNLEIAEDWVQFSLDVPMATEPGSRWAYADINAFLLGIVVEKATGQELETFADTYLFDPLGIEDVRWTFTPNEHVVAQGNFYISARDLASIGQMIVNDGCLNGQQVVSKDWLQASFESRYPLSWQNYDTYGYQWYNHTLTVNDKDYSYVFASGNGGQKLYIVPEEKLVVVTMTTAYNTRYAHPRSLEIFRQVLGSLD